MCTTGVIPLTQLLHKEKNKIYSTSLKDVIPILLLSSFLLLYYYNHFNHYLYHYIIIVIITIIIIIIINTVFIINNTIIMIIISIIIIFIGVSVVEWRRYWKYRIRRSRLFLLLISWLLLFLVNVINHFSRWC